jgi:hypothetical protein
MTEHHDTSARANLKNARPISPCDYRAATGHGRPACAERLKGIYSADVTHNTGPIFEAVASHTDASARAMELAERVRNDPHQQGSQFLTVSGTDLTEH